MRNYNLTYNNPYNRKIANKIIGLEMMKNQIGQPEKINNNIPQATKPLSGGAIKMSSKQKSQLNKMIKRGRGMVAGNSTSAPSLASRVEEMDMVQPMRRGGEFVKPVKDLKYNILPYETNASNSPYYNQLELNKANVLSVGKKMPMTDKVNEKRAKKPSVKDVKEGGAMPMPMPARKIGGKRVAGIGEYKGGMLPQGELELEGGLSFKGIGDTIKKVVKKAPSLIKKAVPTIGKKALNFMKGPEGQKVIGNVLSEIGTQAIKKIFEAPALPAEQSVLGSGIKTNVSRDDFKTDKEKEIYDKLFVNKELRKDKIPFMKDVMKRLGMKTTKKDMNETMKGGFAAAAVGAVADIGKAVYDIVTAENERAKKEHREKRFNKLMKGRRGLDKLAKRYIQRQKEKGIDVDVATDPIIERLKERKGDWKTKIASLSSLLNIADPTATGGAFDPKTFDASSILKMKPVEQEKFLSDMVLDLIESGEAIQAGSSAKKGGKTRAKKGLEPKKEPIKIPIKKGGKSGVLGNIIDSVVMKNKKGGAQCGGAKPKRKISDKMKKRAELVKKIMKEQKLNLAGASKYIKDNKLTY